MRNRRAVHARDEGSPGNRASYSSELEHANLELLANVASGDVVVDALAFRSQITKGIRSSKRHPNKRKNEFMRSGGCLDDGDTTASDDYAAYLDPEQKHTAESEDPVQDRRKRLKPSSTRHNAVYTGTKVPVGAISGFGSCAEDRGKPPLEGFDSFATKYRDVLKYADADEAEAVYSMVALTQANQSAWAEGQGTTAPHPQEGKGELLHGVSPTGLDHAAAAAGQVQDPAMADASTPAASHTEGVASDHSTKSTPAAKSQATAKGLPSEQPVQQPMLRPIMPGMMLAPMPMPGRPGVAAPGTMSMPLVPPPFPFSGAIMAMPGMAPSMAPFMPPWAYPPMFGAMPMPMIGPNGQTLVAAGAGPQGMSLMPMPPGGTMPPGMMLGMPPYMAGAAVPPVGSTAAAAGMGSPLMGVGLPLSSMTPVSMGPLCVPPAAPLAAANTTAHPASPATAVPVGAPAPALPVGTAPLAPAPGPTLAAPVPAAAAAVFASVLASDAPGCGGTPAAGRTAEKAAMGMTMAAAPARAVDRGGGTGAGCVTSAASAPPGGQAAAEKPSVVVEPLMAAAQEASKRGPAESMQSSQQQLCLDGGSPQQGEASHPQAAATGLKAEEGVGAVAGGGRSSCVAANDALLDKEGVHSAIEQLNVAELKPWVLSCFNEDVYLMLLDVWRPDSPKVRDAIWAWRLHVQQPRPNGGGPDYRAFLVSLFGLEKLLQVSLAAQQKGVPCICSCAAHDGAARLRLAAAAVKSSTQLVPPPQLMPVDG